jgi:hypothetical protein
MGAEEVGRASIGNGGKTADIRPRPAEARTGEVGLSVCIRPKAGTLEKGHCPPFTADRDSAGPRTGASTLSIAARSELLGEGSAEVARGT